MKSGHCYLIFKVLVGGSDDDDESSGNAKAQQVDPHPFFWRENSIFLGSTAVIVVMTVWRQSTPFYTFGEIAGEDFRRFSGEREETGESW